MFVSSILLQNFRNYRLEEVAFSPRVNLFYGENAQGKTNLAEAVYFGLQGQSYRTRHMKNIVRAGADRMGLALRYDDGGGASELRLVAAGTRRTVTVDEKPLEKGCSHAALFNVVSVCPDDVELIKGGPAERRAFLDGMLIKVDALYYSMLRDYSASLDSRNKLLINGGGRGREFEAWNEQFLKLGEKIEGARVALIEKITPVVRLMHRKIAASGEELQIEYDSKNHAAAGTMTAGASAPGAKTAAAPQPPQPQISGLRQAFVSLHGRERAAGRTLIGPHLADLDLRINNVPIKAGGSEGQMRTALFALKIGQARMVKFFTRKNPVFIFDDVLLELDEGRKKAVFSEIREEYQVFVTSTRKEAVSGLRKEDTATYRIKNGKVFQEN